MQYDKCFEKHYSEWFRGMKASRLIEYEKNLCRFLETDLYDDFPLIDEVLTLRDLIRDECVFRVSKLAETDLSNK